MTGYTSFIDDGKITNGKEFLTLCLREFGILYYLRDEPLDVEIPHSLEYDSSMEKAVEKSENELKSMQNTNIEKLATDILYRYQEEIDRAKRMLESFSSKLNRANKILREIQAWEIPSEDFSNIKSFALDQVQAYISSLEYSIDYYEKAANKEPPTLTVEALLEKKEELIKFMENTVKRDKENLTAYKRTFEKNNKFLNDFFNSIENL